MQQDLYLLSHFLSSEITCISKDFLTDEIRLCGKLGSFECSGGAAFCAGGNPRHRSQPTVPHRLSLLPDTEKVTQKLILLLADVLRVKWYNDSLRSLSHKKINFTLPVEKLNIFNFSWLTQIRAWDSPNFLTSIMFLHHHPWEEMQFEPMPGVMSIKSF